jgi:hypothetical protein
MTTTTRASGIRGGDKIMANHPNRNRRPFNKQLWMTDPVADNVITYFRHGPGYGHPVRTLITLTLGGVATNQTSPIWTRDTSDAVRLCEMWSKAESGSPAAKNGHHYGHIIFPA